MDMTELRVFVAVAEELHFGRAARRLHMAQPPVSRTIRTLEAHLGVDLFERSTRSVALTAVGRALLDPARQVIAAEHRAQLAVRAAIHGELGVVRIAYAGASSQGLIGSLAQKLDESKAAATIELIGSVYGRKAINLVQAGDAELALGRWDSTPPTLRSLTISAERLVLAVPASDPRAGQGRVGLAAFADSSFLSLPDDSLLVERLQRIAHQAGFTPRLAQTAPDTSTIIALVSAGLGCSLTVSSVRDRVLPDGVAFLDLDPEPDPISLRLVWRADETNPAVHLLLAEASKIWPREPAPISAEHQ